MTIFAMNLSKQALAKIPSEERTLFLGLAHLSNEIRALEKLIFWSGNYVPENNAASNGQISLQLMLLRILAGMLHEGQQLLQKKFNGSSISRDYEPALSSEARDALKEIRRYFAPGNLIHNIRNRAAFHYSPDEMDAALPGVPDDLEIYMQSDGSANNLYYFAEILANKAILRLINAQEEVAFTKLVTEVIKVTHWFVEVTDSLMAEFLRRHNNGIWEDQASKVTFDGLPAFQSIRLPWFTETSGLSLEQLEQVDAC